MENTREKLAARVRLPNQIVDRLRDRILSGELREGVELIQEALAAEYAVSRAPIREALRQLEAEGLVNSAPHRSAIVSEISVPDITEIFELRALIECELLKLAMPKIQDHHLARADEIIRLSYASKGLAKMPDWGELNWQFHSALYIAAERPSSLDLLRQLHQKARRYLRLHMVVTHGIARARQDHRRIVELCAERNLDEGIPFLRTHILDAGRDLASAVLARSAGERVT